MTTPTVPLGLQRAAAWCWRLLVLFAGVLTVLVVAKRLELVLIPLATALLLSALLEPLSLALQRLRLGRGTSAVLTVVLAVAVLGGVAGFVINRASQEYPQFVDQLSRLVTQAEDWLQTGPLKLKLSKTGGLGQQLIDYLRGRQSNVASGVVSAGRTALDVLTGAVLTIFLTIFLLYDGPQIWRWTTALTSDRVRSRTDHIGTRMWETLSGYVRGTFLVALFHATAMGITLLVLGVPLLAPLVLLIFVGAFVPLIGAVVFGGLAVLVALVTKGTTAGLVLLIVLVVENQVEGHVLQPFVVGRHVSLHPMGIALTLTAGAVLAGLPGAIFGVPLVAAINAAVKAGREPFEPFRTGDPPDD